MQAEYVLRYCLLITDTIAHIVSIVSFVVLLTDYCGTGDTVLLSNGFLRIKWSDIQ